ncbi:hypothetical protein [Halorubellus litoreus]|uniref:Uncharacterized protein n=1 Tax=Halorubellus litoreus TaxID=755308 RepID=A0ABD5VEM3_9EURY
MLELLVSALVVLVVVAVVALGAVAVGLVSVREFYRGRTERTDVATIDDTDPADPTVR